MGAINPPNSVLPLMAVTSRYDEAFVWAQAEFEQRFGPVELYSHRFEFDQTDYYRETMGVDLQKQFLVASRLKDPGGLSEWKRLTQEWEDRFVADHCFLESRPINLDPGYISEDKLVLASTKNHAHRLYLSDGIYAEFTLQYRSRQWQACPWTYPDYRRSEYHEFFLKCRQYLRSQPNPMPPSGSSDTT